MSGKSKNPAKGPLQVSGSLVLRFSDAASCHRARDALAPESEGFVSLEVRGCALHLEVPVGSLGRVLATVDDTLACLQAACASEAAGKGPAGDAQADPGAGS